MLNPSHGWARAIAALSDQRGVNDQKKGVVKKCEGGNN